MIHLDLETFSTAGYVWDPIKERWGPLEGASKAGLPTIGCEVYALHPSTRIVCLAWGANLWWPGDPDPTLLLAHIRAGGLLAAWNSAFEFWVWNCAKPAHWPVIKLKQITDGMPRARAWSLPGALGKVAKILQRPQLKDEGGFALMKKFSMPRNPTKLDKHLVYLRADLPEDAAKYGEYCLQDVVVETDLCSVLPELSPLEKQIWELDQEINVRGIPVDVVAVDHALELLRQSERVLNAELAILTGGAVTAASQAAKLTAWCNTYGADLPDMRADTVKKALNSEDLNGGVRRALEIRQQLSSTSTKKVWAFKHRTAASGRCYGQFLYGGAARTLRWAGYGIQPHNFPRGSGDWTPEKTERFLAHLACRDYHALAAEWGDPMKALSLSLRGLIKASPGTRFLCADYSAIEAVVLAIVAGEQWRIDVFNTHGKIYETSASKITGVPLQEYLDYAKEHGKHHPDRGVIGKIAELASGYGGGVGAWKNFGAEKIFDRARCEQDRAEYCEQELWKDNPVSVQDFSIRKQIRAWRAASPAIVALWKGLEDAAIAAVKCPGQTFSYKSISYVVEHGTLYCALPSGRRLAYHQVKLVPGRFGGEVVAYYGWNSNPKFGGMGWVQLDTYGGKLVENVVQAIARDLLAWGMLNVARAGYKIVMHIHDEIVCEEAHGFGSVAELVRLMLDLPDWAKNWPLKADGWEGERFRK